jgi:DNA replication and repair protein RecF
LDSVYYLCYTKSYFHAYQVNNVQYGKDGFRIEGLFEKDGREELVTCKWKQGRKEVYVNNVEYEKPTDHIGKYAAVMIAPDDTELINGGSELRRRWVDSILSQVDKGYLDRLLQYQHLLMQRNAWLKRQATNPDANRVELEYYNARLVDTGNYIYAYRTKFVEYFLPLLENNYKELSGGKEKIEMVFESPLLQKPFMHLLDESLQNDLRMQRTLKGIHRDDLIFLLNGVSLKGFASQGQKKSFLFALKLAQFAYLADKLNYSPILLLDDIFEKLDQKRIEALLQIIRHKSFGQVLLTDTHNDRVKKAFGTGLDIEFIQL